MGWVNMNHWTLSFFYTVIDTSFGCTKSSVQASNLPNQLTLIQQRALTKRMATTTRTWCWWQRSGHTCRGRKVGLELSRSSLLRRRSVGRWTTLRTERFHHHHNLSHRRRRWVHCTCNLGWVAFNFTLVHSAFDRLKREGYASRSVAGSDATNAVFTGTHFVLGGTCSFRERRAVFTQTFLVESFAFHSIISNILLRQVASICKWYTT